VAGVQADGDGGEVLAEGRQDRLQALPFCGGGDGRGAWSGAFRAQIQHSRPGCHQGTGLRQGRIRCQEPAAIAEGVGG